MKELSNEIKNSFFVWVACISLFVLFIFLSQLKGGVPQKISDIAGFFVLIAILIGVPSFIIFFFSSLSYLLKKKWFKKWNSFNKFLKIFLIILVFPLALLYDTWNPIQTIKDIRKKRFKFALGKTFLKNFSFGILIVLFLLPIWGVLYFVSLYIPANMAGLISAPIPIAGTGSMYPTFPKSDKKADLEKYNEVVGSANFVRYPNGINILGLKLLSHNLERGDIITFENSVTRSITKKQFGVETGFMKRLIALPGDTLELREGIVYLNGKKLKEPYTAKTQSTFAEDFLSECKKIKIPPNKIFAMGDNRKGSGDSREIGFVNINDVDHVLSIEDQKGKWDKNWRNTDNDFDLSSKIKLDREKYLELLNSKRKEAGVKPLKYQPKLEKSGLLRGEVILKYDDFSWEATKSGYTMYKAMLDANYSNITYGEAPTQGYFEADELIDNQFQFPKSKEFLLNKDYEELGIAETEGMINGCPTQVIVQHFAGYIPPNYNAGDLSAWRTTLSKLKEILPSWETIKDYSLTYINNKKDADRLFEIINLRISRIERIVYKMENKQWLTNEEISFTNQDLALFNEQETIAKKLNSFRWQH